MSLAAHSRRGIWRVARKNQHKTWRHTNKQPNCVSTLFSGAQKQRNKGKVVEIHSSLVVLLPKPFGSKPGESESTSVWVAFLRKPLAVREGYGQTKVYCFRLS